MCLSDVELDVWANKVQEQDVSLCFEQLVSQFIRPELVQVPIELLTVYGKVNLDLTPFVKFNGDFHE